ncbi:MAG: sulfotransferase [Caldilinea sp.]|nr:sulfotransferase [Caldilineaceae bacterium]MCW5844507.1 sulfotransferase [Caldilinea sp.]
MIHGAAGLRPTFLVIGAYKAGTTSIHHYLKQHPQVFMSQRKEIRFLTYAGHERLPLSPVEFASLPWPVQTLPAYEALFAEAMETQDRGDVSPSYLEYAEQSIIGIRAFVPEAKLIAILRQPADRAYSNHLFHVRVEQEEELEFRSVLRFEAEGRVRRVNGLPRANIARGFYYEALQCYFQAFPREKIRVWLYEDLRADAAGLMRKIFRFLAVDETFTPDVSIRYNAAQWPRLPIPPTATKRLRRLVGPFMRLLSKDLHRSASKHYRTLSYTQAPELDPALRSELTALYRDDILRTQDLIGRDLGHWLEQA